MYALGVPEILRRSQFVGARTHKPLLAFLAAAWYDHPAQKLTVIGVTGTDGKTTTTSLIYSILRQAGLRSGMISTVSAVIGERDTVAVSLRSA